MPKTLPTICPLVSSIYHPTNLARDPLVAAGVTVHHAAHRSLKVVQEEGIKSKIGYHLIIDREGKIHQTTYLDRTVWHAGKALWNGRSPNREHVAVCLLSWGRLKPLEEGFVSWAGAEVPRVEARRRPGRDGKFDWWDACTQPQEAALIKTLSWLIAAGGIAPSDVAGHDEAALPLGRKDDPGGSLSWGMNELRQILSVAGSAA